MIKKDFVSYIMEKSDVKSDELVEKDIIIHSVLIELSKNRFFRKNFVFKGGTCLIKCYLGYYRFSEDLDFSWINQDVFKNKSGKQIRKKLSLEINRLLRLLEGISNKLKLKFEAAKQNQRYVEIGGSNKFVTFKLWYDSAVLKSEQFIKIQVNFVELFLYKIKELQAKSLIKFDEKELKFLFPEYSYLVSNPKIKAYDIKEVLVEKIRAILTRRGLKRRDFIDVFVIIKEMNRDVAYFKRGIIEKTRFMLRYEKYLRNIKEKKHISLRFRSGDEQRQLIHPLDKGFNRFLTDFLSFLNDMLCLLNKKKEAKSYEK
ncbi:MAG: nucleotidyl transferase AbiEii/AbiGii toxin family protein [Nanoarchaeota archaeon]|nr:nucleotidyl transferase AbiEii/AbiGii toxin family protein [Nanoarchaeota archaeon]